MAPGTTSSPGSSASVLQQLFGNIGRFNPGAGSSNGSSNFGGSPGGGGG